MAVKFLRSSNSLTGASVRPHEEVPFQPVLTPPGNNMPPYEHRKSSSSSVPSVKDLLPSIPSVKDLLPSIPSIPSPKDLIKSDDKSSSTDDLSHLQRKWQLEDVQRERDWYEADRLRAEMREDTAFTRLYDEIIGKGLNPRHYLGNSQVGKAGVALHSGGGSTARPDISNDRDLFDLLLLISRFGRFFR